MSLLPPNSKLFEIVAEEAMDETAIIDPAIASFKGLKYQRPLNPTIAPYLVQEYGLSPISEFLGPGLGLVALTDDAGVFFLTTLDGVPLYVPGESTIEDMIDQGRPWQRIRGTPEAITTALQWVDYSSVQILDQVIGRRRWHLYQIDMGELPGEQEASRLASAEYLAGISDSSRNLFWRGFYGYDVRGHVWGRSRYGQSIWGDSSGVRLGQGKTKWSHGRFHSHIMVADATFFGAMGLDYEVGDQLNWPSSLTWQAPGIGWTGVTDAVALQAWAIARRDAYIALYDIDGAVIAYSKVVTAPEVIADLTNTVVRFKARTGFGDGSGSTATSLALVFGGRNAETVAPFKQWLLPDEVVFDDGEIIAGTATVEILFAETIREFFTINLLIEA